MIIGLVSASNAGRYGEFDSSTFWACFLGGGIGGWFLYVNVIGKYLFEWILSKIIGYEMD